MPPLRRRPKPEDEDKWIKANTESQLTEDTQDDAIQSLRLRVPSPLLKRIDALVSLRQPRISRHQWILEALLEKAKRDERKESK